MGFKAHVVTEASASGAQVIDGSLKFDGGYLTRTPTSVGNRRTFTWSAWIKRSDLSSRSAVWGAGTTNGSGNPGGSMYFDSSSGTFRVVNGGGTVFSRVTSGNHRDTGWYHIAVAIDTTQSRDSDRITIYINGEKATVSGTLASEDFQLDYNNTIIHAIGTRTDDGSLPASIFNGHISQVYLIDGLALGPGYFGFTDPLTNTWRPKKFRAEGTTVNDGTVWSNGIPGNAHSSYPATNGFDGSSSTFVYAAGTSTMTWTAPKRITGQKIEVYVYAGGGWPILKVNGQSTGAVQGGVTQHNVWVDVTDLCGGPGGVLETIIAQGANIGGVDRQSGFAAVRVDGVIMKDSTTQNLDFGTNGFYLPMDGNSPIGKDQSGNGNDFTPSEDFSCSAALDKATGALPIMNTVNGGRRVGVGVRTDAYANDLVLALPLVGSANDVSNQINSTSTTKSPSVTGATFDSGQSNFYGGGLDFDGPTDGNSAATDYVEIPDSNSEFAIGTGDFTMECWVWGNDWTGPNTNKDQVFMSHDGASGASNYVGFYIPAGVFAYYDGDGAYIPSSNKPTLNDQQWYHVAVSRKSGTSRVFLDGVLVGSASDTTDIATGTVDLGRNPGNNKNQFNGYLQDFRLYVGVAKYTSDFIPASTNPDIFPDTPSGVSGDSKLKSFDDGGVEGGGTTSDYLQVSASGHSDFEFSADFTVEWFMYRPTTGNTYMWTVGDSNTSTGLELYWGSSGNTLKLYTNGGGQNLSGDAIIGWSHYAVVRSGSTITVYYNGTSVGTATNSTVFTGNFTFGEYYNGGITGGLIGPITNFRYVKGTAVYTSNFTPPTEPLTAITNTKLLCFRSNSSATEAVVKPANITSNGTITLKGLNPFNTDINAVRGQESGYPTLDPNNKLSNAVLSNNNLTWTCDNSGAGTVLANMAVDAGKYYWEVTVDNAHRFHAGVHVGAGDTLTIYDAGAILDNNWAFRTDGAKVHGGSESSTNFSNVSGIGNVIQLAYDADGGNLWFGANGRWFEGNPSTLSGPSYTGVTSTAGISPMINRRTNDNGASINFGQKPFKYAPPIGFSPINSASIRSATIPFPNPNRYVGAITYQGATESPRKISLPITPDLIWVKNRTDSSGHYLFDTVRGDNKNIRSDGTFTESAVSGASHGIISTIGFNSFTVKDGGSSGNNVGSTGTDDFVAWFWKAGGNKGAFNKDDVGHASAAAAGLSAGTITPTGASIGTKQGFSIITWTGTGSVGDIPHGLTQDPDVIMIKNRENDSSDWYVFGKFIDDTFDRRLTLNSTANAQSSSSALNGTSAISSTIVKLGANEGSNGSSDDMLMYAWHSVPGVQKFGTYIGNGSSDGPVIKLGFRPALLIVKSMDASEPWAIYDNVRNIENPNKKGLYANDAAAENDASGRYKDFTNDGFKVRGTSGEQNGANKQYFYMAWAEAPAFNLYGASAPAR